jgi:hypothetical protein
MIDEKTKEVLQKIKDETNKNMDFMMKFLESTMVVWRFCPDFFQKME